MVYGVFPQYGGSGGVGDGGGGDGGGGDGDGGGSGDDDLDDDGKNYEHNGADVKDTDNDDYQFVIVTSRREPKVRGSQNWNKLHRTTLCIPMRGMWS